MSISLVDHIVLDDIVKEENVSEEYRRILREEFNKTLMARVPSDGSIMIITSKLHEDDLMQSDTVSLSFKQSMYNPDNAL